MKDEKNASTNEMMHSTQKKKKKKNASEAVSVASKGGKAQMRERDNEPVRQASNPYQLRNYKSPALSTARRSTHILSVVPFNGVRVRQELAPTSANVYSLKSE
uniref:Uncharacterized protein n=1 Tax=Trypanosoma vivax (strain Y486) TaxID=1055687 RepID=G0U690_TRYVY|nr:hypothetical protein, unlikely [Trypanosoma vivax Y486]